MCDKIYEESTLKLGAHVLGQPKESTIVFKYLRSGVLVHESTKKSADHATDEAFDVPRVKDDEDLYELEGYVFADDKEILVKRYQVYPRVGVLEAVDEAGPTDAFRFRVVQENKPTAPMLTKNAGTSDVFNLALATFAIEPVAPWIILDDLVPVGRKRKVKVKRDFVVELLRPAAGKDRQYINLDTTNAGADRNGRSVEVVLRVRGDDGRPVHERFGTPDERAYVKVEFAERTPKGHADLRRSAPIRQLQQAGTAKFVKQSDASFTAEVPFAGPDNTAVFTVDLGAHGGDRCKISVGSTPAYADGVIELENWRRVYYEPIVPDVLKLNDLPDATKQELERIGNTIFVEYALDAPHVVPIGTLPPHTLMPLRFLTGKAGDDLVFLDYRLPFTACTYAKNAARTIGIWLGDLLWKRLNAPISVLQQRLASAQGMVATGSTTDWWLPATDIPTVWGTWTADVTLAGTREKASHVCHQVSGVDDHDDVSEITVTNDRGTARTLVFKKARLFIDTDLDAAMKADIRHLVADANDHATLRANKNVATFQLAAPKSNPNHLLRISNVKDALSAAVKAKADFGCSFHPGIDDQGAPRTGQFGQAEIDLDRSFAVGFAFKFPSAGATDPGKLVGPATKTTCNLLLDIHFIPHTVVGGGALAKRPEAYIAMRDLGGGYPRADVKTARVIAHEFGHKMGMSAHGTVADQLAPGLPAAAAVDQPENRYSHNGALGHMYKEKGHTGPHCAYGLDDSQKALSAFPESIAATSGCIMYGLTRAPNFCPQCVDYLSAVDLTDIRVSR